MRHELTDYEWTALKPMLPNRPRGVPRVNDRRVLNGIFWVLRSGAPWRDLPALDHVPPCAETLLSTRPRTVRMAKTVFSPHWRGSLRPAQRDPRHALPSTA